MAPSSQTSTLMVASDSTCDGSAKPIRRRCPALDDLALELDQLVLELLDGQVERARSVGGGHLALHLVAVALDHHLADLLVGDAGVLLLGEVDPGDVHALDEAGQLADLAPGGRHQRLGRLGPPAADGDLHGVAPRAAADRHWRRCVRAPGPSAQPVADEAADHALGQVLGAWAARRVSRRRRASARRSSRMAGEPGELLDEPRWAGRWYQDRRGRRRWDGPRARRRRPPGPPGSRCR